MPVGVGANNHSPLRWQRNYYEHIIRDVKSLYFIRNYIRQNPLKWDFDHENHIEQEIREFALIETGCAK